ncbi:hypothetical protein GCM10007079_36290 [Nocardiopsis terrae]|nr:hypothetical protein GCM10007079_36290 [Nocardiopsis terrae]
MLAVLAGHQGVGVGTAVGTHGGHVLRVGLVRDVEDPDALEPVGIGGGHGGRAALVTGPGVVHGEVQQVPADRDVSLTTGAQHLGDDPGSFGFGDVVDDEAVVVAADGVVTRERQVRVEGVHGFGLRNVGHMGDVVAGLGVALEGDLVRRGCGRTEKPHGQGGGEGESEAGGTASVRGASGNGTGGG